MIGRRFAALFDVGLRVGDPRGDCLGRAFSVGSRPNGHIRRGLDGSRKLWKAGRGVFCRVPQAYSPDDDWVSPSRKQRSRLFYSVDVCTCVVCFFPLRDVAVPFFSLLLVII